MSETPFDYYKNWAKALLAEMEATLTFLEKRVGSLSAVQGQQAEQVLIGLRKIRDDFKESAAKQKVANEAAWKKAKAQLETEWTAFEAELSNNIKAFGEKLEQQQPVLQQQAAAQLKAWHELADELNAAAKRFGAARQVELQEALKHLQADAELAEKKLQKVNEAGSQSWSVLMSALQDSRTAFGKAAEVAQEAFRKAAA